MSEIVQHKEANAGPLGLLGFGMTTVLLNLHNAGIIEMSIIILAMGLAMGGLAQFIAGLMEFKAGNTFGATAFTSYGLFWWSLVIILVNPSFLGAEGPDGKGLGFYMILWCIFTFFMFIGTLKANHATQLVFGTLALLFLLLAIENFTGSAVVGRIAGVEGIICGAIAIYTAVAGIVDGEFNRPIMPV
ncbi:MAG: acetate uptake transporter [Eubacterium sp.]|nr:acetate uptake transporter [Eubacterium sp.]